MSAHCVPLLDAWRRNISAQIKRSQSLKLCPQHVALLREPGVVASLAEQNAKMAGTLLRTDGTAAFRRFTPDSLAAIEAAKALECVDCEEEMCQDQSQKKKKKKKRKNKKEQKDRPKPSSDLEAGKVVPFIFGDPPPELLNVPLEDLDPFYRAKKTFVVISKGNVIHRFNAEPALDWLWLRPFSPVRQAAIQVLLHSLFRLFIVLTILANCVFLAMPYSADALGFTCIAVYTLEALIKVLSRGLCLGRFTFLRDRWNWLDVFVILMGYLGMFIHLTGFTMFAVLKVIPLLPGQKRVVGAMAHSLRRLRDAAVITLFSLVIFASVLLQVFMGGLRTKCILIEGTNGTYDDLGFWHDEDPYGPRHINNHSNQYFLPGRLDPLVCGTRSDAGGCPAGFICLWTEGNPNYGYTSYDNFLGAFLSVVRLMAQDYASDLIALSLRAGGTYNIYFFVLMSLGCFCLLSLLLAAVSMAYAEMNNAAIQDAKEKEEEYTLILEEMKRQQEQQNETSAVATSDDQDMSTVNVLADTEITVEDVQHPLDRCTSLWRKCAGTVLVWNCCSSWVILKKILHTVMTNPITDLLMVIVVITNIVFMSMEHYELTYEMEYTLQLADKVFVAVYTMEMALKITAVDPYHYFQVSWNILDAAVVFLAILESSLADVQGLSFLRLFRTIRIFKLAKFWPSFHSLLSVMHPANVLRCGSSVLLVIFFFFFTVMGTRLFGQSYEFCVCKITKDCELPRWHMADLYHSFLTVFYIVGGRWVEVLWDCMEVSSPALCVPFYMAVTFLGTLLMLHLFLTLLLRSFSGDHLASMAKGNGSRRNLRVAIGRITHGISWAARHVQQLLGQGQQPGPAEGKDVALDQLDTAESGPEPADGQPDELKDKSLTEDTAATVHVATDEASAEADGGESIIIQELKPENGHSDKKNGVESSPQHTAMDEEVPMPPECCTENCIRHCPCLALDITQGRGKTWWTLRRACHAIVEHRYFNIFMIIVIVLSSIALTFEDIFLEHRPVLKMVVEHGDQVFTAVFLTEMVLKWMAYGFNVYFNDIWCCLDFFILNVSVLSFVANGLGSPRRSSLPFRAVIPLRLLSRSQRMQVVLRVLKGAIPSLINALLACLTLWLVFSIVGVNLFAGKFYHCFNKTSDEYFTEEDVHNKTECFLLMEGLNERPTEVVWKTTHFNFDNVMNGYVSLFHVSSQKSGMDVIYSAVDSRLIEEQPIYEDNLYASLYFVFFSIFGVFFTLIFFIGAIIENFNQQKSRSGEQNIFLTDSQRGVYSAMKKLGLQSSQKAVSRPQGLCCHYMYDLVTSRWFDIGMMVVVLLSILTTMLETADTPGFFLGVLYFGQLVLIFVFLIEFILKILGLGKSYFSTGSNILDFIALIVNIISLFLADLIHFYLFPIAPVYLLRLARTGRVLPLIPGTEGIRTLFFALKMARPALSNIALLFGLTMFVFSIFGMSEFPFFLSEEGDTGIDELFNFQTFFSSFKCLFICTLSGGWESFVYNLVRSPLYLDKKHPGFDVWGSWVNPLEGAAFIYCYVLVVSLLVIYMFIAFILETFDFDEVSSADAAREDDEHDHHD
ncbi:sodium channel protein type 4 subunit alpha A-like isoform X1 [Engraulis encrasicolus]|uniref:sodium channel protein type 4 subunit alpha A-like isoform X1 n=1 Tax=Engraulis encrasicolus TaxID=184585 RepID=UPI002FD1344A